MSLPFKKLVNYNLASRRVVQQYGVAKYGIISKNYECYLCHFCYYGNATACV